MCPATALINKVTKRDSALIVQLVCQGHTTTWRLQPWVNNYHHGSTVLSASILFSINTYVKIRKYFDLTCIPIVSHSGFYKLQKKYLFGIANEAWIREQNNIIMKTAKPYQCVLSGDGRCDNTGHNAKYLIYTFLEQTLNKIVGMSITQVTECGNSNRMEKYGFQKL